MFILIVINCVIGKSVLYTKTGAEKLWPKGQCQTLPVPIFVNNVLMELRPFAYVLSIATFVLLW